MTLGLLEAFQGMPLKANCFSQSTPIGLDCLGWKRCVSSSCEYFFPVNFQCCPPSRSTCGCRTPPWPFWHLRLELCSDKVSLTGLFLCYLVTWPEALSLNFFIFCCGCNYFRDCNVTAVTMEIIFPCNIWTNPAGDDDEQRCSSIFVQLAAVRSHCTSESLNPNEWAHTGQRNLVK